MTDGKLRYEGMTNIQTDQRVSDIRISVYGKTEQDERNIWNDSTNVVTAIENAKAIYRGWNQ